jgi:hypothetical protein
MQWTIPCGPEAAVSAPDDIDAAFRCRPNPLMIQRTFFARRLPMTDDRAKFHASNGHRGHQNP